MTAIAGGAIGFTVSWFTAGVGLITLPILVSTLFLQSLTQQLLNQAEYLKFTKIVKEMLNDEELQETLRTIFLNDKAPPNTSMRIEMKPSDLDQNTTLKYDFGEKSSKNFEEIIAGRMKEEFGLIEKPTEK